MAASPIREICETAIVRRNASNAHAELISDQDSVGNFLTDFSERHPEVEPEDLSEIVITEPFEACYIVEPQRNDTEENLIVSMEDSASNAGVGDLEVSMRTPAMSPVDSLTSSSVTSSGGKKPRYSLSMKKYDTSAPEFREPFSHGWRRELVYRNATDSPSSSKRQADVYYYAPNGIKLRSSREVSEYLSQTQSTLTMSNFTFAKDKVGIDDPALEIVRDAKKVTPRKPTDPEVMSQSSPIVVGPGKRKRPLPTSGSASPSSSISSEINIAVPQVTAVVKEELSDDDDSRMQLEGASLDVAPPAAEELQEPPKEPTPPPPALPVDQAELPASPHCNQMGSRTPPSAMTLEERKVAVPWNKLKQSPHLTVARVKGPSNPGSIQSPSMQKVSSPNQQARKDTADMEMGMLPPDWEQKSLSPADQRPSGVVAPNRPTLISTLVAAAAAGLKGNPIPGGKKKGGVSGKYPTPRPSVELTPCSIRCPGLVGVVPSQQCVKCLCLYHPSCLGLVQLLDNWVCQYCQTEVSSRRGNPPPLIRLNSSPGSNVKGSPDSSPQKPIPPPPPLVRAPTHPANMVTSAPLPLSTPSSPPLQNPMASLGLMPVSPVPLASDPPGKENLPAMATLAGMANLAATTVATAACTWTPPSGLGGQQGEMQDQRKQRLPKRSAAEQAIPLPGMPVRPHNVANIGGNRFILIPKIGSDLDAAWTSSPQAKRGQAKIQPKPPAEASPAQLPMVPSVSTTEHGLMVSAAALTTMPPPSTSLRTSPATVVALGSPQIVTTTYVVQQPAFIATPVSITTVSPTSLPAPVQLNGRGDGSFRGKARTPSKPCPKRFKRSHSWEEEEEEGDATQQGSLKRGFMATLCSGYGVLLQVFKYLSVQDLLQAAQVCRLWRDVAAHSSLWTTVRMKNSHVVDWEGFASQLSRCHTKNLDLRKMLMTTDSETTWANLATALAKVNCLSRVEFSRCPAFLVEDVAGRCPQLEAIVAPLIMSNAMHLAPFGKLPELKELKLKSSSAGFFAMELQALGDATSLKHLSLTSVKELYSEQLLRLSSLRSLESLELGHCNNLHIDAYSVLASLPSLKKLRLERCDLGEQGSHLDELASGHHQLQELELINFGSTGNFEKALAQFSTLKKLLLIPSFGDKAQGLSGSDHKVNTAVVNGIKDLKSLELVVWGVTNEYLRKVQPSKKKRGAGYQEEEDHIPLCKESRNGKDEENGVETVSLYMLQRELSVLLPLTKVLIIKIPYHATWRQNLAQYS